MRSPLNLYKETGVTGDTPGMTPVTPQDIAATVYRDRNSSKIFGRISLISTVDKRIDDKAHRILCLIAACAWKKNAPLAFDEIAFAVNCSPRTAIRHIAKLEALGYIVITRCHNRRNEYVPGKLACEVEISKPAPKHCLECQRACRGLNAAGHCRACASRIEDDRLYEAALRVLGPSATPTQIGAHLHAERQAKRWVAAQRRYDQRNASVRKTA